MAKPKEPINPFNLLCGVLGVLFTITACAYGLLLLRTNRGLNLPDTSQSESPLMNLLDRRGLAILGVEVGLLFIVAMAAIVLDHYRGRRAARQQSTAELNRQESDP